MTNILLPKWLRGETSYQEAIQLANSLDGMEKRASIVNEWGIGSSSDTLFHHFEAGGGIIHDILPHEAAVFELTTDTSIPKETWTTITWDTLTGHGLDVDATKVYIQGTPGDAMYWFSGWFFAEGGALFFDYWKFAILDGDSNRTVINETFTKGGWHVHGNISFVEFLLNKNTSYAIQVWQGYAHGARDLFDLKLMLVRIR